MTAADLRSKTEGAVCERCPCGLALAEIDAALDAVVRHLLRFSVGRWRALRHEAPAGVDLDIVRVAYAEAALIRQEFRAIIGGDERC